MGIAMRYFALLDGKEGNYGVVVPDLPGCTSAGKTADAAYRNAIEAVRLWVEDALEDGEKLPRARSLMEMLADKDVRRALADGAALMIVPLVRDAGRPTKANVSMDAGTLQAIDEEAAAHGLTRSAFIASAALEKIRRGT
jgi:predicted RNase H-like HicB family nuclease